jgi:hypothetical protein
MPVLIENIVLKSKKPNFERDSVKVIGDLLNANPNHYDVGHIVYCQEDGKHYVFRGTDSEKDDVIGYFRPIDKELKELLLGNKSDLENQLLATENRLTAVIGELDTKLSDTTAKLDELYLKEHPCKASIKLMSGSSAATLINKKGDKIKINLHISITRDGKELDRSQVKTITLQIIQNATSTYDLIRTTKTYDVGEVDVNTTYKIKFELISGEVCEASSSIKFYPMSYFGVFSGELDINSLTPVLLSSRSHTVTINQNNERNCFMYPTQFGLLESIKDSRGYELINSYTKTNETLGGESYYAYTLTRASTVENYKLIFK